MVNDRRKKLIISCIFTGIFFLFLFLNFRSFLAMDDFIYSLTKTQRHLSSFKDVIKSLRGFRVTVNGRIFAHFFAKLFLWLPKWCFNFVNSGVSALLFFMIYKYIERGNKRFVLPVLVIVTAFVFLFIPAFGQVFLWLTGSCNYSWAAVLLLIYLYPYHNFYRYEAKMPVWLCAAHTALAFFAGAYSEHASFGAIFIAFCFFVLVIIRDRKVPVSLFISGFASCAGYLFLMLAPIEWSRQNGTSHTYSVKNNVIAVLSKVNYIVYIIIAIALVLALIAVIRWRRFRIIAIPFGAAAVYVAITALLLRYDKSLIAVFSDWKFNVITIYFISFLLVYFSYGKIEKKAWACALIFSCGAVVGIMLFAFASYISARVFCAPCIFSAVSAGIVLSSIISEKNIKSFRIMAVSCTLLATLVFSLGIKDILHSYELSVQREEYIKYTAGVLEERDIAVPRIVPESKYAPCWPGDSDDFIMDIENYYGLDSFTIYD